ncbi:MAG: guanylate kinase [Erysipelotrichaceae bacterium]|nr:guanylate kinase [Erysipelotrichaceae bacterium]
MSKGVVIILTGASSVGKGKIRDLLLEDKDLNLMFSISMTTRPPKAGEVDGKDYYFVSFKSFAEAIKNRELLEYTEFNGYYYGTPKNQIEFLIEHEKNVLIEVEAQGVGPLKLNMPDSIAFFVKPVSPDELIEQINKVYGDGTASAENRINKAKMDLELEPLFNNVVTNDDPEAAAARIKEVVMAEVNRRKEQ